MKEQYRIPLATFMFHSEAEHQCKPTKRIFLQIQDQITWKSFVEKFNDKYFLSLIGQQKEVESKTFTQDTNFVQFEAKFAELARFDEHSISDTKRKAHIRPTIPAPMSALHLQTYEEVCKRALFLERDLEETEQFQERKK